MLYGRVIGNVVSTIKKDKDFFGHKLMLVQPLDLEGNPYKESIIAVDMVDSGEGELVVFVDEGNAARQLLDLDVGGAARAVIVGIVDEIDIPELATPGIDD